jgi:hypothetical protein
VRDLALLVTGLLLGATLLSAVAGGILAYFTRGWRTLVRLALAAALPLAVLIVGRAFFPWVLFGVIIGVVSFWGYRGDSK